jgi:probable F420-dependent oxidoreductase
MPPIRRFRFGAGAFIADSAAAWAETARRIEALGYATLLIPDHFDQHLAPIPALTAAALATTTLRIGCTVFDNDFRHPAMLAKELATLDLLSDGRLEVGIGAGWYKTEYEQAGIPFDPPAVRVGRLEEAVCVLKELWRGGPVTFTGAHYTLAGLENWPPPVQRPHPPLFIGGGGKRLLTLAAREADIVALIAQATPDGGLDTAGDTEARLAEKVGWVRAAAGDRFEQVELAILIWRVAVSDDRRAAAEALAGERSLTPEQVLASPYFLIGSIEGIVERLHELRERYGVSYISVFPQDVGAFAPVVTRLAGT